MKSVIQRAIQQKLYRLERRQAKLSSRLNYDTHLEWGDDHLLGKLEVLGEMELVDREIKKVQSRLDSVEDPTSAVEAYVVEVDGQQKTLSIVPSHLAGMQEGYISALSPLAAELRKRQVGETFRYCSPRSEREYKIVDMLSGEMNINFA